MIDPLPQKRSKISEVHASLVDLKEAYAEVGKTNYKPETVTLFNPELLTRTQYEGMKQLKAVWEKTRPYFENKRSPEEEAVHDVEYGIKWIQPGKVHIDFIRGDYIGQLNKAKQPNGRGSFLTDDCRSLYEGFFRKGKKHG